MDTAISPHKQPKSYGNYTYTPLPSDGRYIRLIRLLPDANPQAPIQCKLFDYPLQRLNDNHLYEALSYVWGDPEETISVTVNGFHLQITMNLYAALVQLRNAILDRVLWVDAICIDQMNVYERANQVQFMTEIYASASQVVIWLGEEEDPSSRICSLIRLVAETSSADGKRICEQCKGWKTWNEDCPSCGHSEKDTVYEGRENLDHLHDVSEGMKEVVVREVRRLLHLPWFTRVWVLQEAAAARRVLIMLGRQKLNGYTFSHGIRVLAAYIEDHTEDERSPNPAVLSLIGAAEFRPQEIKSSTTFRLGIADLAELVNMFHLNRATDPRDKIYALLGMLKGTEIYHQLTPNYIVEWEELFERLIRTLLGQEIQVAIGKHSEKAIIKGLGFMLGSLISIQSTQNSDQTLFIEFEISDDTGWYYIKWRTRSPARPVKKGDLICLLCGADYPCVVRPHRDYFDIIMVISPVPQSQPLMSWSGIKYTPHQNFDWYSWSLDKNMPMSDFLLTWDWSATGASPLVPTDMSFIPQSGPIHIPGTSASVIDQITRLRDTVLIKERALLGDQVECGIVLAQNLLGEQNLNSDRTFRDLAIIYSRTGPKSNDHRLVWHGITARLKHELRDHIGKGDPDDLFATDLLPISAPPGSSDVLAFICNHAEHCLKKLDRELPKSLLLLFLLRGDVLPLTDSVIELLIFDPDAIEIFQIVDKTWNRTYEIRVSRDMITWIAHESETKLLDLMVHKCRDQIETLIQTTDMSRVIAIADSIRGSNLLEILTKEFDGDNLKALNNKTLQDAVETYRKARSLDVKAVRRLVDDDIDLNIFDVDYETIILKASRENREDIVRILIDTGKVNLNLQNTHRRTPIYYAIETGSIMLCKILLEHGANPTIKDDSDNTPIEKARIFSRDTQNPDFGEDFVRQCRKISDASVSALVYVGSSSSLNRRRMKRLELRRDGWNI